MDPNPCRTSAQLVVWSRVCSSFPVICGDALSALRALDSAAQQSDDEEDEGMLKFVRRASKLIPLTASTHSPHQKQHMKRHCCCVKTVLTKNS